MQSFEAMFDAAAAAFRRRLSLAVQAMHDARTPDEFCTAEREVVDLARELAADMTQRVMQSVSDDAGRRAEALAKIRARAAPRGARSTGSSLTPTDSRPPRERAGRGGPLQAPRRWLREAVLGEAGHLGIEISWRTAAEPVAADAEAWLLDVH